MKFNDQAFLSFLLIALKLICNTQFQKLFLKLNTAYIKNKKAVRKEQLFNGLQ